MATLSAQPHGSTALAMMSRMISLVPPPIVMSRASRAKRSTGVLAHVAVAAVQLHAVVGHAVDHLGGEELDHRDLAHALLAGRELRAGRVGQPAAGLDLGGEVGQLVADHLLVAERAAEGLPLAHVGDGVLERALGHGHRVQPGHQPLALEDAHDLVEAHALAAQQVLGRHPHVLEG